jgi:PadR family transcriptional regulator, regulatory protein PadR
MGTRLGEFEHLVLLALVQLGGAASGTAIYSELETRLKRVPAVPAVYVTLARLEAKGLISSRLESGGAARSGRRLKRFAISATGRRTLRETRRALESLWKGLSPEYGQPS